MLIILPHLCVIENGKKVLFDLAVIQFFLFFFFDNLLFGTKLDSREQNYCLIKSCSPLTIP